jgi:TolC family type I secretion outer membrane protein
VTLRDLLRFAFFSAAVFPDRVCTSLRSGQTFSYLIAAVSDEIADMHGSPLQHSSRLTINGGCAIAYLPCESNWPSRARRVTAAIALLLPGSVLALDPFGTDELVRPIASFSATQCGEVPADKLLTVSDVVDLALCRNPRTSQAWAIARVQAAQVGVARSRYLPEADATLSATRAWVDPAQAPLTSPFDQSGATITASYLLFDFGARGAALESARQLVVAADATLESTIHDVFVDAVTAFYQVQATQAALEAATSAEQAAQESFKAAEARYAVGAGTPADKLQAQTAFSQATLNRIRAEGDVKIAQGTVANVIGLDADRPTVLATEEEPSPPESFEENVHELINEARRRRPDLASAEAQTKAARADVDTARAAGKPTLSVTMSSSRTERQSSGSLDNAAIGLNLRIPLFAGFGPTYRIRGAEAQLQSTAAQRDRVRLQVALDVWSAYHSLSTAIQTLRTTADLLASAEQSAKVALGRYKAGVGSILDVLNAQSALANAQQQRIQAFFSWNIARVTLAQSMGTLDQRTLAPAGFSLPEQQP